MSLLIAGENEQLKYSIITKLYNTRYLHISRE